MTERRTVGLIGDGPAISSVKAAVTDIEASVRTVSIDDHADSAVLVLADRVGRDAFRQVNETVSCPWIAIEEGGIGGYPHSEIAVSVSVLSPETPCFACLQTRVGANLDEPDPEGNHPSSPDRRLAGALAGRKLVDLITGTDRIGTVQTVPTGSHELLPVPTCSCHSEDRYDLRRDVDSMTLEEAVTQAERAIDERIGLIASIGEAESFPAPYYLAQLADFSTFSDVTGGRQAAGVASDWHRAFMKAAGEALERYCAGVYRTSAFRTESIDAIESAVPPRAFVLPSEQTDTSDTLQWVPGEDLVTEEQTWLPAEFIQFPPPTERHRPAITTGLGLGSSGVDAILSGLYEVIERDATMLAWYSTFEPLGLSVTNPTFSNLSTRAHAEGLTVTPLLVTQDIDVPVVTVAVHRSDEWPQFAVGSSANLDPDRAAIGALEEALQNWMELRGMGREEAADESTAIGRYASFPPEVRSLIDVDDTVPIDSVGQPPRSASAALETVCSRVQSCDLDAYAVRLTPPDVEAIGFEAVRVVIPEAQPLFTDDRYFGDRAKQIPPELGYRPRLDRPPHPYP